MKKKEKKKEIIYRMVMDFTAAGSQTGQGVKTSPCFSRQDGPCQEPLRPTLHLLSYQASAEAQSSTCYIGKIKRKYSINGWG